MLVSVSTMPAGENVLEYVKEIENNADFMHLDICDGKYNQTKCFSKKLAKLIRKNTTLPMDAHLMTLNAKRNAKKYIKCGANIITAQIESFIFKSSVKRFIKYVKSTKTLVGLALEPNTRLSEILPYLSKLDLVLVMSVKTGKSGQEFNQVALKKIEELKKIREEKGYNFKIEVDGGVNNKTIESIKNSGADIVVSGNYIYKNEDKNSAIESLK